MLFRLSNVSSHGAYPSESQRGRWTVFSALACALAFSEMVSLASIQTRAQTQGNHPPVGHTHNTSHSGKEVKKTVNRLKSEVSNMDKIVKTLTDPKKTSVDYIKAAKDGVVSEYKQNEFRETLSGDAHNKTINKKIIKLIDKILLVPVSHFMLMSFSALKIACSPQLIHHTTA